MRAIKEEEVTRNRYADFHAAYQQLGRFLDEVYQRKRLHSALGGMTPEAFATPWPHKQPNAMAVKLDTPQNGLNSWGHHKLSAGHHGKKGFVRNKQRYKWTLSSFQGEDISR